MIFLRPESDARREVSADRFLESHFWPMDGLVMSEILFFAGIGKISYACLGGWWWVVDGGWWMKKCVLENLFLVQKHALRAPARGGGGGGWAG